MNSNFPSTIGTCRICGDAARYVNYGVLTCSSCKIFFRRHGFHQKTYTCTADGHCQITKTSRRFCVACRFAKCLTGGMNSSLIRKEEIRRKKPVLVLNQVNQCRSLLPTLDLLRNDRSSLDSFNWTMLSNVVHAFDRFSPVSQARQLIEHLSASPKYLPFDVSPVLDLFNQFYVSTELFISSSADFQILTLPEKQSLYERNLHGVLNLYATFVFYMTGMFTVSANEHILSSVYGSKIFHQTKNISFRLQCDPAIIKLLLFILAFSSNCYMVDEHENMHRDSLLLGTFRLFGSQNMYIEILWKFMIYRHGDKEAPKRLLALVKSTLDLLTISAEAHKTNTVHQTFVDEVAVRAEESLVKNENEVVPLWGRSE